MKYEDFFDAKIWKFFGPSLLLIITSGGAFWLNTVSAEQKEIREKQNITTESQAELKTTVKVIENEVKHLTKKVDETHEEIKDIKRILQGGQYGRD